MNMVGVKSLAGQPHRPASSKSELVTVGCGSAGAPRTDGSRRLAAVAKRRTHSRANLLLEQQQDRLLQAGTESRSSACRRAPSDRWDARACDAASRAAAVTSREERFAARVTGGRLHRASESPCARSRAANCSADRRATATPCRGMPMRAARRDLRARTSAHTCSARAGSPVDSRCSVNASRMPVCVRMLCDQLLRTVGLLSGRRRLRARRALPSPRGPAVARTAGRVASSNAASASPMRSSRFSSADQCVPQRRVAWIAARRVPQARQRDPRARWSPNADRARNRCSSALSG